MIRRGMSSVLVLVVSSLVLLTVALTLMFILVSTSGSLLPTLSENNVKSVCMSRKNSFCASNPSNTWKASDYSYQNLQCSDFFEREFYDCGSNSWVSGCNYWRDQIKKEGKVGTMMTGFKNLCENRESCKEKQWWSSFLDFVGPYFKDFSSFQDFCENDGWKNLVKD